MSDLLNNLGVLYHQMGDYEHALVTLEEGLEHARLVGYKRLEAFLLASLGDLFADLQANDTAQQLFTLALDNARQIENRFLCFYVNYALANLARNNGKYTEAHRLIETAMKHLQPGSSLEQGLLAMGIGQLAVKEKDYEEAHKSYSAAIHHFRRGKLSAEEMKAHLCLSAAFFESDDQNAFLHHLQDAFRLTPAISSDYHPLLMSSFCAFPVLERARRDLEIGETVANLLDRLRRLQADLPNIRRKLRRRAKNIPMIEPQIVIQTLGATRIKINGKTIKESDWKSRLQRELFFYLLQHPDGASKDSLLSLFWHGTESPKNYLATTIYKIHRVLGESVVQFRDGRYYFNRALDYEYDVESFFDQLNRARQENDHSRRIPMLLELLSIYQGEFLSNADGTWAVADRERLFQAYIEAVGLLGESLTYQGEHRVGLDYFLQAIDRDPCREEFYRLAMKAASALGDRDRISYFYRLCQQALAKTHGVEPSPETRKLYLHLMQFK